MASATLKNRSLLWVVLYSFLAVQTYRYATGASFYGEYLHWTGEQSVRLLIAVLAVAPLRRLFPRVGIVRWISNFRRDIGVAAFTYAAAHTIAYLGNRDSLSAIVSEGLAIELLTGWIAFAVFLLLAATSNDLSVRLLKRNWTLLHKAVFAGALLTMLHWILTAFDPTVAYIYLSIIALLIAARVFLRTRVRERSNRLD